MLYIFCIVDEDLGKHVGFLIIELQLCIRQPDKALSLITYLHNQILNGSNNIKAVKPPKTIEKDLKDKKVRIFIQACDNYGFFI